MKTQVSFRYISRKTDNFEFQATQFIDQELSTVCLENQLYPDLYTVDLNSSIMDYYSSVMDHDNSIMDLETPTVVLKSNPDTGYSLSEAFIIVSINPKYDIGLFVEL